MTPTLLNGWLLGAGLTFLGLLVAAGLHFKDPKQRGLLLLAALALAAFAWPVLVPFWAIERLLWRPLGALATRRMMGARNADALKVSLAQPPEGPSVAKAVRHYGDGGKVVEKGPPS